MRRDIRNEMNQIIGWSDEDSSAIHYYTYKNGQVGQYNKATRIYRRWKQIPGKPIVTFPDTGDYGEQDVRYWG